MEKNNITAVGWLTSEFRKWAERKVFIPKHMIQQAKRMERDIAYKLFKAGQDSMEEGGKGFEQYYNETYGK